MKFASADIESNQWIFFNMIGIYNGTDYFIFDSIDKFIDYIVKNLNGYRIYFHNGGRFDFLFLIEKLLEIGQLRFIEKAGGFISIKFLHDKKKCSIEFCDSYCLLPASLDKLIKTFNIEHKKIEIDFKKTYSFNNKRLQQHLKNDVLALYDIIELIEKKEGKLYLTVASQAMNNFKNKFFSGYIWNANDNFDGYFRKNYYRGGRVEVYKGYGENLYYYDFNSLYPFVMLNKMPCGAPIKTDKFQKNKIGYYKIKLLTATDFLISPLIIKSKTGNFYVNGNVNDEFYVMNTDIEILIRYKIKFDVIDGYYFKEADYLFKNYVDYYYKIKQHAKDEVERYLSKLMLNSLYGKFGQRLTGQRLEVMNDSNYKEGIVFDAENDLILVDRNLNVKFKGIHIACYITSLARYYLFNQMEQIGFNNVWYCDTDSIITNKKIKVSDKIGGLKLEAKIKEAVFLLPKTYGYIDNKNEYHVKYKGFKSDTFSYNELKKLLTGKIKELKQVENKMLGFRSAVKRKNNILKSAGQYLKLVEEEKILTNNYTKRKIVSNNKYIFTTQCFNSKELKNENKTK